eukprot:5821247-Amphidinium_carterae.1
MECFRRIGQNLTETPMKLAENHTSAALIMDDYNNRVSTVETFSNVPFFQTLNLQGRLLKP